jgi:hypothetical protein
MKADKDNLYGYNKCLKPFPNHPLTPGDCVTISLLSFRASEARHGIQYFHLVLDAGFRRHECAWEQARFRR